MSEAIGPATPASVQDVMAALRQANEILKERNKRIAELEAALHQINALIDSPARFNKEVQDVLDSVVDTSDVKFSQ